MRGHVRKRRDRWEAIYDLGPDPETGKRRQRSKTFVSNDDAENWLAEQIHRVANLGLIGDPKRVTVREYVEAWLDALPRSTPEEENTAGWYKTFARHVIHGLGSVKLRDLLANPILLERFKNSMPDAGARYNAWRVLTRCLGEAVRLGILAENPCHRVRGPRAPKAPPRRVWTPEQLRAFLTHPSVEADDRYPLWWLIACTGMRRSEALGLHWLDVDSDAETITIRQAHKRRGGDGQGSYRGLVKAGNERTIDVDPPTLAVLRRWRKEQTAQHLRAGKLWRDREGLVFTTAIGDAWDPTATTNRFNVLCDHAGLPPLPRSLHGLRHTHATHLLSAGWDVGTVASRLGHKPETLVRAYAHVLRGRAKTAASYVSDLVAGTPSQARNASTQRAHVGQMLDAAASGEQSPQVSSAGPPNYGLQVPQAV